MKVRKFLSLLAVSVLLASAPYASQQQDRQKGQADRDKGIEQPHTSGSYVYEWPFPESGERPSHYPPYYQDTH